MSTAKIERPPLDASSSAAKKQISCGGPAKTPRGASRGKFNWQSCNKAFKDQQVQQLSQERGVSRETCLWLKEKGLIGLFEGCIAFPVHDDSGKIIGAHYNLKDGSWGYRPDRIEAKSLIIGPLEPDSHVYVFESEWDAFAFLDISGERTNILVIRRTSHGADVADLLPKGSTVYVWMQNDASGEKWLADICECAKSTNGTVKRVKIPELHKHLNDWIRAGATCRDLLNAMAKAEVLYAPVTPRPLSALLDAISEVLRRYVVFQMPEQARVIALWIVQTWVLEALDYVAYLHIHSAEKRSGKSRLLDVMALFVKEPWRVAGVTWQPCSGK